MASGTLWSKSLLGATNGDTAESWYGNYYAWGELEEKAGWDGQGTKVPYDWTSYKYANGDYNKLTKYCNTPINGYNGFADELTQLVPEDDAATATNSAWRMPTKAELEELIALPSQWVTDYSGISGLNGRVFTGTNGNTLFIPTAGYRMSSLIFDAGSYCYLWSSSLDLAYPDKAFELSISSRKVRITNGSRSLGCPICPVCK